MFQNQTILWSSFDLHHLDLELARRSLANDSSCNHAEAYHQLRLELINACAIVMHALKFVANSGDDPRARASLLQLHAAVDSLVIRT